MARKKRKDTSWKRFFNPSKSPHGFIEKLDNGQARIHLPKNIKPGPMVRMYWPSKEKGTFVRAVEAQKNKKFA
jgi:hypothetical protein